MRSDCPGTYQCYSSDSKPPGKCVPICSAENPDLPERLRLLRGLESLHPNQRDEAPLGELLARQAAGTRRRSQRGVCGAARRWLDLARSPRPSPPMKPAFCAAFALVSSLICGSARASDKDPWFGPDKALHFGVSVLLASGGYAASSPWLDTRTDRALAGGAFSLSLGAGKELWDLSGHGDPSWRDFTWDVLGTAVGLASERRCAHEWQRASKFPRRARPLAIHSRRRGESWIYPPPHGTSRRQGHGCNGRGKRHRPGERALVRARGARVVVH